jgi:hypothetical protein
VKCLDTNAAPADDGPLPMIEGRRYLTVMFCDLVVRLASLPGLMLRSGAIWSARIWMLPLRR